MSATNSSPCLAIVQRSTTRGDMIEASFRGHLFENIRTGYVRASFYPDINDELARNYSSLHPPTVLFLNSESPNANYLDDDGLLSASTSRSRGRLIAIDHDAYHRLVAKQQSTSVDSATARTASDIECETPNQHPHIRDTLT